MEREILFKGKRIDNGKWAEGDLIIFGIDTHIVPICGEISVIEPQDNKDCDYRISLQSHAVDFETVCQYTGLTDKNDRKIFEGDIVKYHFGEAVAPIKFGSYQSCFDSQQTEHCGFYVDWKTKRNYRKDLGYWVHMVDAEIVGNIYDNPELLKG